MSKQSKSMQQSERDLSECWNWAPPSANTSAHMPRTHFSEHHAAGEYQLKSFSARAGLNMVILTLEAHTALEEKLTLPRDSVFGGYVQDGKGRITLPDMGTQQLAHGEWFFCLSPQIHAFVPDAENLRLVLWIMQRDYLRAMTRVEDSSNHMSLHCFTCQEVFVPAFLKGQASDRLKHLSKLLIDQSTLSSDISENLRYESYCLEGVASLLEQDELRGSEHSQNFCNREEVGALQEMAHYLETHLEKEHSLHELSQLFRMNECKLKRGFREIYGNTIFNYLREKRMEHAEYLLRCTDHSILEVANSVGYANASHFSRNFKKRYGLLPRAYRCVQANRAIPAAHSE